MFEWEVEDMITRLIEEVGLTDKTDSRVSELSGGMKRRLMVAIALVCGIYNTIVVQDKSLFRLGKLCYFIYNTKLTSIL